MSGPRKPADGLLGVAFRFFLCLLLMKFVFLDWFRFLAGPGGGGGHEEEIAAGLDGFTRGPRFPARKLPPTSIGPYEPGTLPPIPFAQRTGSDPRGTATPVAKPAPATAPVDRNGRPTIAPRPHPTNP